MKIRWPRIFVAEWDAQWVQTEKYIDNIAVVLFWPIFSHLNFIARSAFSLGTIVLQYKCEGDNADKTTYTQTKL